MCVGQRVSVCPLTFRHISAAGHIFSASPINLNLMVLQTVPAFPLKMNSLGDANRLKKSCEILGIRARYGGVHPQFSLSPVSTRSHALPSQCLGLWKMYIELQCSAM